mmetsp:Transcript_66385/g.167305  ORF Transcript_66385/g.167305 Transcript_66385/m.167305 type:complete len:302 (-) Transcript_66385:1726-2631(-)
MQLHPTFRPATTNISTNEGSNRELATLELELFLVSGFLERPPVDPASSVASDPEDGSPIRGGVFAAGALGAVVVLLLLIRLLLIPILLLLMLLILFVFIIFLCRFFLRLFFFLLVRLFGFVIRGVAAVVCLVCTDSSSGNLGFRWLHVLLALRVFFGLEPFHDLLEERLDIRILGVDEDLPVDGLAFQGAESHGGAGIEADIGVAYSMDRPAEVPVPWHLDTELGRHQLGGVQYHLRSDHAPGAVVHDDKPPLLELRAPQEGSVHRPRSLVLREVRPVQLDRERQDVALGDLLLVVHLHAQ